MPEQVTITINGSLLCVDAGVVVAAAMIEMGAPCRVSTTGEPRTAVCGMGTCFECRATVNGIPHHRTCQLECEDGMRVETMR